MTDIIKKLRRPLIDRERCSFGGSAAIALHDGGKSTSRNDLIKAQGLISKIGFVGCG
jgi:hypothetical protein